MSERVEILNKILSDSRIDDNDLIMVSEWIGVHFLSKIITFNKYSDFLHYTFKVFFNVNSIEENFECVFDIKGDNVTEVYRRAIEKYIIFLQSNFDHCSGALTYDSLKKLSKSNNCFFCKTAKKIYEIVG